MPGLEERRVPVVHGASCHFMSLHGASWGMMGLYLTELFRFLNFSCCLSYYLRVIILAQQMRRLQRESNSGLAFHT